MVESVTRAHTMSDDIFSPILAIMADITRWGEALRDRVDASWNEEQQKLLEIILTSAHNPARWLPTIPTEPNEVTVWKHDALSPIIAITGAAELLVEDFTLSARHELKDLAQSIFDVSVKARKLVIKTADKTQRQISR